MLLIVLWVRSYGTIDSVSFGRFSVASNGGLLTVFGFENPQPHQSHFKSLKIPPDPQVQQASLWFFSTRLPGLWYVGIPLWFPALLSALLGLIFVPSWSTRFSLRTLLIATTLVAVVLGLAVYAAKR